ncbi:hypothetical protein RI367_003502 [Sorochytrium milnesiophthora]
MAQPGNTDYEKSVSRSEQGGEDKPQLNDASSQEQQHQEGDHHKAKIDQQIEEDDELLELRHDAAKAQSQAAHGKASAKDVAEAERKLAEYEKEHAKH